MSIIEIQVDRIVGPTHHYGGLGVGNLASASHRGQASRPKIAALQGLNKMRLVAELGVPQFILPPQRRPVDLMLGLGVDETRPDAVSRLLDEAPGIISAACSSSAMWNANAATVTPAIDTANGQTYLTIANLCSSLHRAMESSQTFDDFSPLMVDRSIQVWPPLLPSVPLRDEGAANHMRFCNPRGNRPGIHVFVHGDPASRSRGPLKFFARQTRLAFQSIARRHGLSPDDCFFVQQNPGAIDAGAFHNDVVAMSHHHLWIHHAAAYAQGTNFDAIEKRLAKRSEVSLVRRVVSERELPLEEAVQTYLFNSQIVSTDSQGPPEIICPVQVQENHRSASLVEQWIKQGDFSRVHYVELRQSMAGGGGPACLRLRIPLERESIERIETPARWTPLLDAQLRTVIEQDYVESLLLEDLRDADLFAQLQNAQRRLADLLVTDVSNEKPL